MNYRVATIDNWEWQKPVLDKDLTSPPLSPLKGNRYLIYGVGSGPWIGQNGNITEYNGSSWFFINKYPGMVVFIIDENKLYIYSTSWLDFFSQYATSKVRTYQSIAQTIPASTWTRVNFQTINFDVLSEFSSNRFTAKNAGYYFVNSSINVGSSKTGYLAIYKNGVMVTEFQLSKGYNFKVSDLLFLSVNDYVEIFCYMTKSPTLIASSLYTYVIISRSL